MMMMIRILRSQMISQVKHDILGATFSDMYNHHFISLFIRSVLTYRNMERDFSGGWKVVAKNRWQHFHQ